MTRFAALAIPPVAALLLIGAAQVPSVNIEDRLTRHRNLGKAFYENPTTQTQAVAEFAAALKLAPNSLRERLNYGLALLRAAKIDAGIAELEAVQKKDPSIPHTWFNLGIEFKKSGEHEKALDQFQRFVKLVPNEPISQYNIGVLSKLAAKPEQALAAFERASKLDPNLAAAHFQLFNAYRVAGRQADAQRELAVFQGLKKATEGTSTPEDVDWSAYSEIYEVIDPSKRPAPLKTVALKFDDKVVGEGVRGVVAVDGGYISWGATGIKAPLPVPRMSDVVAVAPADFNNDGLTDLCVVTAGGVTLLRNTGKQYVAHEAAIPAGKFHRAIWLDYDHDYDLDLILLGAQSKLYRNQGTAGFADKTSDFPFAAGEAIDGIAFRLVADTRGWDLLVSYANGPGVLYRDKLMGKYVAEATAVVPAGTRQFMAADVNNDGHMDVLAKGALFENRKGVLQAAKSIPGAPLVADAANDGAVSLEAAAKILPNATAWATGDFDKDGREDYAAVAQDGKLHQLLNRTVTSNRWLRVKLTGVKNQKLSPGAEIEVKAGTLYQKKVYRGRPLLFGLRNLASADTVRITWPNGLIQNELKQLAGKEYTYKEAERLSGSCPIIWTWDGDGFRYITDVLGVAPLGATSGDGQFFDVDHDEYIQIPGDALKPVNGEYEVRITEELSEVAFLDHVKLIAVDRPAGVDIFTNDKWKAAPFPEFRLYGVAKRIPPIAARDERGRDVLARVLKKDATYPDTFARKQPGVAEMHEFTLDFGPAAAKTNSSILVLSGWVDWADGSTFLAVSQEDPRGLVPPVLQVKNESGEWVTVIEDMGMPAGKPKTIAVDLSGKFIGRSREIRILTNLCVYWDEVFLSEETAAPQVVISEPALRSASVQFRGFSPSIIHPERRQPERFVYEGAEPTSLWNQTPGLYTRYGPVETLLTAADDRMVVMGSGDEIRLRFAANGIPLLKPGWKRDYLLLVDGWAKDRDANTAEGQTVEPLPFHKMTRYPLKHGERHPDAAYEKNYNTRPGLRLLRPLTQ